MLNLVTCDFQPLSIVEDSGFKDFVEALNPNYVIPSRKVLAKTFYLLLMKNVGIYKHTNSNNCSYLFDNGLLVLKFK